MSYRDSEKGLRKLALILTATVGLALLASCSQSRKADSDARSPATSAVGATAETPPKFLNTVCPIMGSKIDPDNVPANLTRDYKGGKVAFCCGGCPPAWDKLSDEEKAAKLAAASPAK